MRDEESTAVSERKDSRRDIPAIVDRYLKGESVDSIAADNLVSRRTIYNWMLAGLGEERYHQVVTECLVARVADADQELAAARLSKDPVRVSAAREACRFARTDLERRRPKLYGVKQEVEHTVAPVLNIVLLDRPSGAVVDVTPVAVLEPKVVVGVENKEKKNGEG